MSTLWNRVVSLPTLSVLEAKWLMLSWNYMQGQIRADSLKPPPKENAYLFDENDYNNSR